VIPAKKTRSTCKAGGAGDHTEIIFMQFEINTA